MSLLRTEFELKSEAVLLKAEMEKMEMKLTL